ncbi:cell agglutination protein Mam3 [Tissierella sp.]|uniref:cell agglutination protein Mam3 n=1 Tax=Tissierella sp. TaxID=41274 RepID=UPI0028A8CE84|nr:cell agglutination protein Mam3 [Tissierella sp.]
MKLKRIGVTTLAIALLVGGGATNATYAMELREQTLENTDYQVITPMWDNISGISPSISAEGTTLYPEVYIKAKSSSGSISGTMYLERYDLGRWISVTSWSFKGTSYVFLSKSYTGMSGVKYRTRVVVSVDGEKAEATSGSCEI